MTNNNKFINLIAASLVPIVINAEVSAGLHFGCDLGAGSDGYRVECSGDFKADGKAVLDEFLASRGFVMK